MGVSTGCGCKEVYRYLHTTYAPINVSPPPPPGEVRQSWGFDLIRIQLPHPPGNIQIQIPPRTRGIHGEKASRMARVSIAASL